MDAKTRSDLTSNGPAQSITGMCFDNSYARLPDKFHEPCVPDSVASPELVSLNHTLARNLGMNDPDLVSDRGALADLFSGNCLPVGAQPIAMRYAGHQFGVFLPELGDRRVTLVGEVIDNCQQRRDLQLKGCGSTPLAHGVDGHFPLGDAIREYIFAEAMHALGVPTTRILALTTTKERVNADISEPAAILTRVASSHIRIGTFEYFARRQEQEALKTLADYTIARLCPELIVKRDPYLSLMRWVVDRQAKLVAHWVSLGFVHGMMNTDATLLVGETLSYGSCGFLDGYDPDAFFSSVDVTGRYAYNNQAFAAQWNLARLAETLVGLFRGSESKAVAEASRAVKEFRPRYEDYLLNLMRARLGFEGAMPGDRELVQDLRQLLAAQKIDYHTFFHKLADDIEGGGITAALFGSDAAHYLDWYRRWHLRLTLTGRTYEQCFEAMAASNPLVIPRNHLVERAIQRAQENDFSEFHQLLNSVIRPFKRPDEAAYLQPPSPC